MSGHILDSDVKMEKGKFMKVMLWVSNSMLLLLTVIKDMIKVRKYLRKHYTDILLPFSAAKPMDQKQMQ